jgi:hypothetical protein
MQMCRVADHWQAAGVSQTCFEALMARGSEQLPSPDEINLFMSVLALRPGCVPWLKLAERSILSHFSDVHLLLTSELHLAAFLQLPFALVHAWVASDSLVVDSENSVVVAVDAGTKGKEGAAASDAELKQLSDHIRVTNLTTRRCPLACNAVWHCQAGGDCSTCMPGHTVTQTLYHTGILHTTSH